MLGGFLALPLCLFSYWMDSYWGGAVAAAGGALVLGSYARIVRRRRFAFAWLMGIGLVVLAQTRMYEGLLFAAPFLAALLLRCRSLRVWVPIAVVLAAGAAFTLQYNARVTGHAMRLPYMEYQRQYGYVPLLNIQTIGLAKTYRNLSVANVFLLWEYDKWKRSRSWHLLVDRAGDWGRFLALVQAFRHLRHVRWPAANAGRALCRAIPVTMLAMLSASQGARLYRQQTIEETQPVNARRTKNPHEEWVYNRADIDASDVVWAHDMGVEENRKLVGYFKNRTAWLFLPDDDPESLAPYGEP